MARALALGGRHLDVGQLPEEEHVVLADPEGNEFCVIEPGNSFLADCGFIGALSCDGSQATGYFWSEALGWPLVWDQDEETAIRSPHGGPKITWGGPPLNPKTGKDRLHLAPRATGRRRPAGRGRPAPRPRGDAGSTSARARSTGWCWPTPTATSSACSRAGARRLTAAASPVRVPMIRPTVSDVVLLEREDQLRACADYLAEAAPVRAPGLRRRARPASARRRSSRGSWPTPAPTARSPSAPATAPPPPPRSDRSSRCCPHLPADVWPPGATRHEVFTRLVDTLRDPPDGRPYLLVVEDAHWADEATLDLLRHLARRIHGCRALVLVTYRPEDAAARPAAAHPAGRHGIRRGTRRHRPRRRSARMPCAGSSRTTRASSPEAADADPRAAAPA